MSRQNKGIKKKGGRGLKGKEGRWSFGTGKKVLARLGLYSYWEVAI